MFRAIILLIFRSPKHFELTGIINKPLLLHLVGCLYYLYQLCTVQQISDNEIYLLIKYIKIVLWKAAKRLSYIEDARCLKVKHKILYQVRPLMMCYISCVRSLQNNHYLYQQPIFTEEGLDYVCMITL